MIRADVIRDLAGARPLVNLAYLERGRDAWIWRTRCAVCGLQHVHGGGLLHEDPRRSLGPRSAYCCGGYEIVDGDPARTAELVHQVRMRAASRN